MKYILETERLRLRELNLNDSDFIIELLNTPAWLKYIGDRNVKTTEQAESYLHNGPLKSYEVNGYGLYLVEKKDIGTSIGMCGILKRDNLDHPDIGFAFLPEFNGQGYAFEIATATIAYAKNKLGLSTILAITVADNFKSIKLLGKIGLTCNKKFNFPNSEEELLLFST
jgi:RimJ/RimL family protein N-acetyltransferase